PRDEPDPLILWQQQVKQYYQHTLAGKINDHLATAPDSLQPLRAEQEQERFDLLRQIHDPQQRRALDQALRTIDEALLTQAEEMRRQQAFEKGRTTLQQGLELQKQQAVTGAVGGSVAIGRGLESIRESVLAGALGPEEAEILAQQFRDTIAEALLTARIKEDPATAARLLEAGRFDSFEDGAPWLSEPQKSTAITLANQLAEARIKDGEEADRLVAQQQEAARRAAVQDLESRITAPQPGDEKSGQEPRPMTSREELVEARLVGVLNDEEYSRLRTALDQRSLTPPSPPEA
ncbi:MAG: hypothetical protein HQL50_14820, partial [Magnetococcales bacterium]|nr:hypothetical protein [Magnetococcales bacterium]